jgi:hypothetical protein
MPAVFVSKNDLPVPFTPVMTAGEGLAQPIFLDFSPPRKVAPPQRSSLIIICVLIAVVMVILTSAAFLFARFLPFHPTVVQVAETAPPPPVDPVLSPMPRQDFVLSQGLYSAPPEEQTLPPVADAPPSVGLIPILQTLPLYAKEKAPVPTAPAANLSLHVETSADLADHDRFMREGDEAFSNGNAREAIGLYTLALQIVPQDNVARNNLAALWLDEAGVADNNGKWEKALSAYIKALHYVHHDPRMRASIRARARFIATKIED